LYGDGLTFERTCQDWFQRFRSGDVSLEDKSRSGRPVELDEQALIDLIKEDNRQSTRDLAEQLNVGHSTVAEHLQALGYKLKLGAWVPQGKVYLIQGKSR
jgi:[histone H3]-lysine36 N-dimethyltransferase SETMAR